MVEFHKMVVEVDFNQDDDKEEFGEDDRIMSMNRFAGEEQAMLGLRFNLGRKEDDFISLSLPYTEFIDKLRDLSEEAH